MPLESSVKIIQAEIIQVLVLVKLGIQARPRVLLVNEERVVLRQPPRPQVPYEVGHIFDVVVYPWSTKRKHWFSFVFIK